MAHRVAISPQSSEQDGSKTEGVKQWVHRVTMAGGCNDSDKRDDRVSWTVQAPGNICKQTQSHKPVNTLKVIAHVLCKT